MVLDSSKVNIKYVAVEYWGGSSCNMSANIRNSLKEFLQLVDFGKYPGYAFLDSYKRYRDEYNPMNTRGIFLGDLGDINNTINSKLNLINPSTFKKVYFDPNCKYPRFKLSTLTNIKRCLDPSKADTVIISKMDFKEYEYPSNCLGNKDPKEIIIMFSEKANCYYYFDYYPYHLNNKHFTASLHNFIDKAAEPKTIGVRKWISALINSNIIPSDCTEFYNGNVILLKTNNEIEFINNLYNKYMLITYDTDLDRFISAGLQQPTMEDLETIGRMLSSTDNSVVGMGLKLLSNYDISTSICSVGILIAQNWRNVGSSSISRSTGFEQVLKTLGLTRIELNNYEIDKIINILYKNSTDEKDKEKARNIIKQKVIAEIQRNWESTYAKKFTNIDFNFKFTIE